MDLTPVGALGADPFAEALPVTLGTRPLARDLAHAEGLCYACRASGVQALELGSMQESSR